jgi:thiol-disulfide isomerase/thioredoxin
MGHWHTRNGFAILCCGIFILLCGCEKFKKKTPLQETLQGAVVDASGQEVSSAAVLDTEHILLYFSAHWCPPCQAFTPELVEFYKEHGGGRLFEVILISNDHSEDEMFSYMNETGMSWPAVKYRSDSAKKLDSSYSGDGIPRLVLLDPKGEIVSDSFKGREYLGPQVVLENLKERLANRSADSNGTTGTHLPTPAKIERKFIVNGFGQGVENIAIINGEFTPEGTELSEGIIVEDVTDSYVEVSYEGNRYRLYP